MLKILSILSINYLNSLIDSRACKATYIYYKGNTYNLSFVCCPTLKLDKPVTLIIKKGDWSNTSLLCK